MKTLKQIRSSLPSHPVEVVFPDISCWQHGNTGVEYLHTIDSGIAGPHAMIMGLTHGNEVSGAIAVDTLLRAGLRPPTGRISLGFANVEAYRRFDPDDPDASRFVDEDLNRVWSESRLDGSADSLDLRRARALRPVVDTVDFLLDIHSMHEAAPPLMLSGPLDKGIRFAAEIGVPENVITDVGHANGTRLRDYGGFGDPASPKNALLIETGQHFAMKSKDVALDIACRFLLKVNQTAAAAANLETFLSHPTPQAQRVLQVTHAMVADSMEFAFTQDVNGLKMIARGGTVIARDGDREFVTPYDNCIVVMPSVRQLRPGRTVMRFAHVRPGP